MNGKCLDIGTIQAFLDGELRPEQAVSISDHVESCDPCTILLAQADEENSLVFSVLDRELNTLVPTQRLWGRINDSIAEEKSRVSVWQRIMGFVSASLLNPSFAAAGGILLMVGMVAVVWNSQSGAPSDQLSNNQNPPKMDQQIVENKSAADPILPFKPVPAKDSNASAKDNSVRETQLPESELRRMVINANYKERGPKPVNAIPASAQYLPGEENYIKTIGELQGSVTAQNASMSASNQVSYQRDLAVVDDAISKMRQVVKKNPRNQAARQVLYSSYQDKIDLLKSSAGRDDLMAIVQD